MARYQVKIEGSVLPKSFTFDELIDSGVLDEYDKEIMLRMEGGDKWYVALDFPFRDTETPDAAEGFIINADGSVTRKKKKAEDTSSPPPSPPSSSKSEGFGCLLIIAAFALAGFLIRCFCS